MRTTEPGTKRDGLWHCHNLLHNQRLRMLQGRGLRLPINAEGRETANQRWRGVRQPINAGGIQVLVILSTGAEFGIEVSDSPNSHKGVGTMRAKAVRAAWRRSEGHDVTAVRP